MSLVRMSRQIILLVTSTLTCGFLLCFFDSGLCVASEEPAADGYFTRSWQTDEGLPGNAVHDVLQDQQGFIWLATIGGLVRFDGATFKIFSSPLIAQVAARNIRALAKTDDSTLLMLPAVGGVLQLKDGQFSPHPIGEGLAGRQMQTLFVDRSGGVWLGMAGGDIRRWQAGKTTDFGPTNGLSSRAMVSFAADGEGGVWIGSGDFLGCYRDGKLTHFHENFNVLENTSVAASRSGGIWICKSTQLLKWGGGQFSTISSNLPWLASEGLVRAMFEDSRGVLWIGTTAQGLFRFAGGKFSRVETSQSQITAISEDVEGDIWVATAGGGIDRLRPRLFDLYNMKSGLLEDMSDGVCADPEGNVWLANRGGGVVRVRDGKPTLFNFQTGQHKLRAYSVCPDNNGWLWVNQGGLSRFPRDHPEQIETVSNNLTGNITGVHVLFKSRNGDIWIGADPNLLGYFRSGRPDSFVAETNFPGLDPRSIAEDSRGRIWIGTEDWQLFQLADGKFTQFSQKDRLPEAPIHSLYADAAGSVWIGTIGGGLVLWRDEKFTIISVTNGLPYDDIGAMVEDDAGRLWCGSRVGIFHVAKSDLLAFADGKISEVAGMTFGKGDGLAGISCLGSCQPMACKTPDGRLWLATQRGALSLNSKELKPNSRPPPVIIDEIFVNDRPLEIASPLQVPPLCNKIEFHFCVLSYAAPEKVLIRYKLDGVDSGWVEIANRRGAVYAALRPGRYSMHLKACNNDGVWNETGTSLSFVVQPAWWQSRWFQGAMLVVFMAVSAIGIRHWAQRRLKLKLERLERQQVLGKERTRIARDLHDDLGATVTQVGLMLEELRAAPLSAVEIRQQSAAISGRVLNLARDLDAVVWSVNPGNDSLGELFAYLGQSFLECFRRTPIRPRLAMAEEVPDCMLAPEVRHHLFMVVREAMNNVIKHSRAKEVTLSLKVVKNALEMRIEDNGLGYSPDVMTRSKRHGITNMRARVEQLGGKLEVSSEPGKGTSIVILISPWQDLRAGHHRPE